MVDYKSLGLVEAERGMGWKEVAACLQEVLVLGEVDKGVCWREVVDQVGGYREESEMVRSGRGNVLERGGAGGLRGRGLERGRMAGTRGVVQGSVGRGRGINR